MSIRSPALLSASLAEVARLDPSSMSLTLNMVGSSEASLTLPEDAPAVNIHDWISIYTPQGLEGIFRVTNVAHNLVKQIDVTLLHGIDILSDSVWPAQTTFSGTKAAYITALLNKQTHLVNGVKPWVLGTCADATTIEREINYDRLSTLLDELVEDGGDYYFTYDMSTFPWTLNYVARPSAVASEFRLTRNVRTASITYNDADLCTRLHLSINHKSTDADTSTTATDTLIKTYNNTSAQALWGIVVKTADIDTGDDVAATPPVTSEADAWASRFLARRAAPSVQIQVDGDVLKELTGDTWDEYSVGRMCQVALPDYGHTFRERVISVTYPDLVKDPAHITVSLANTLPRFSEAIASIRDEAERTARSARSIGRSAADAKEQRSWSKIVNYHDLALDGTGVKTLYESGIDMDAVGGVKIYSLVEGVQALYAGITVNATEISSVVQKAGVNDLGENETLYSRITQTATAINSEVSRATSAEGNLSSRITQEADKIAMVVTSSGGTNAINPASIVAAINDGASSVVISADHVDLQGYVTASYIDAEKAVVDSLISQNGYTGNLSVTGTLSGGYVSANTVSASTFRIIGSGDSVTTVQTSATVGILGDGNYSSVSGISFLAHGSANPMRADLRHYHSITATETNGQIKLVMGPAVALSSTEAQHSANFNIADTAKYQADVGIASIENYANSTDPSDYADWSGTSAGTLAEDTYYLFRAMPNQGNPMFIKFKTAASSGSQGGIASVTAGGWTYGNNNYYNTVTAVANDGTSSSVTVTLPSGITCDANKGTSASVTVTAYGPVVAGDQYSITGSGKSFYLKSDNSYVYLTDADATPAVGTNVVARASNPAYANGWAAAYGKVTLPSAMTTTSNNLVTVYTPPSTVDGTRVGTNLYLVCDDNYAYIRSVNATSGGSTYARITNPKQSAQGGIASVSLYSHSDASADWTSWRSNFDSYTSISDRYAYVRATANDGTIYNFGLNAEGVYTAGYNAAPVGIPHNTSLLTWSASSNDESIYNGWSYVDGISTGGYQYRQYYVTASNGDTAYIKVNASSTYTAGYNAAPVGIPNNCVAHVGYSNDASDYSDWTAVDTLSMSSYKYKLIKVVANDGTEKYVKIHADGTYNSGRNAPTIDNFDLNGSSASTSTSKPTTSLSKSVTTISGYKWFQLANGSWKNLGAFSITTGATKASSLYVRQWNEDDQAYQYAPLTKNKLYYWS